MWLLVFTSAVVFAHTTPLKIVLPDKTTKSFSVEVLKAVVKTEQRKVSDPSYKTEKVYEGFFLRDLLHILKIKDADRAILKCRDGYSPVLSLSETKRKAFIAFRDVSAADNWIPLESHGEEISPAPYYLVWTDALESDETPWPFQIVEIEFGKRYVMFSESKGVPGFDLYEKKCIKCHSMNLQGGTLGPDLNYKKSVVEYWKMDELKNFILDAPGFRAHTKMPSFKNELSPKDQETLLNYLSAMSKKKLTTQ